jgi:hypothetical protein
MVPKAVRGDGRDDRFCGAVDSMRRSTALSEDAVGEPLLEKVVGSYQGKFNDVFHVDMKSFSASSILSSSSAKTRF